MLKFVTMTYKRVLGIRETKSILIPDALEIFSSA